jgi:UDP-glucuronate 4-epimerase
MNNKKVLITGACGFIGFHLALKFLKNSRTTVYGIDSLNSYYSVKLKKKRLLILKKKKKLYIFKEKFIRFKIL